MSNSKPKKNVLLIGGHDPTGAAGIQADNESVLATGCQPLSIISALTAQNTSTVENVIPQNANNLAEQLKLLLNDSEIASCKIGMLGNIEQVATIIELITPLTIPVVLDPVFCSGSGKTLMADKLLKHIVDKMLPLSMIATPNSLEARKISNYENLNDAASFFLDQGCKSVLITGTHESDQAVINRLYMNNESIEFSYERLPHSYHGSGCTLSASLASYLVTKSTIQDAVQAAQDYTWQTLKHATKQGAAQYHPNRFYNYDHL